MAFELVGFEQTYRSVGSAMEIEVPDTEFWEVKSIHFQIITTATVGNRIPIIRHNTPTGDTTWMIGWPASTIVPASTTARFQASEGMVERSLQIGGATNLLHQTDLGKLVMPPLSVLVYDDAASIDEASDITTFALTRNVYRFVTGDVQDMRVAGVVQVHQT